MLSSSFSSFSSGGGGDGEAGGGDGAGGGGDGGETGDDGGDDGGDGDDGDDGAGAGFSQMSKVFDDFDLEERDAEELEEFEELEEEEEEDLEEYLEERVRFEMSSWSKIMVLGGEEGEGEGERGVATTAPEKVMGICTPPLKMCLFFSISHSMRLTLSVRMDSSCFKDEMMWFCLIQCWYRYLDKMMMAAETEQ